MYRLKIDREAFAFLSSLTEKSNRIIRDHLHRLQKNPFPGQGGDKERIHTEDEEIFRLHISRSSTVIYQVDRDDRIIYVTHLLTSEEAQKRYGRL